jgi:hypothetical protein
MDLNPNLSLQRNINFEETQQRMFQNTNYHDRRKDKISLIIDIKDVSGSTPLGNGTEFKVDLLEPLIIDRLSDVYLDNLLTFNSKLSASSSDMAFVVNINEFNIQTSGGSSDQTSRNHIHNKLIIANENTDLDNFDTVVIHKGKKMNYVCSVNPMKLSSLTGTITNLDNTSIFSGGSATDIIFELSTGPTVNIPVGSLVCLDGRTPGAADTAEIHGTTLVAMSAGATSLYLQVNGGGGTGNAPGSGGVTLTLINSADNAVLGADIVTTANTQVELGPARAILELLIEEKK